VAGKQAKAPAAEKVRKPRKPKTSPCLRALWGVFNTAMKQVAIFDYAAADERLAEFVAKKGPYPRPWRSVE